MRNEVKGKLLKRKYIDGKQIKGENQRKRKQGLSKNPVIGRPSKKVNL